MRWVAVGTLVGMLAVTAPASAQSPDEIVPLPYPDRIEALKAPVNALLNYRTAPPRRFVNEIIWGPEKAPGLYRLRAEGTIAVETGSDGPIVVMDRTATGFSFGPKDVKRPDEGRIEAAISPLGGFKKIELKMPGLDAMVHRLQFGAIGTHLIDTGRIPPFQRLSKRTGPDDSGGQAQNRRENTARIDILEALQPVLGMVLDLPPTGLHTGSRLTVIRRDLGDLFRDAGAIPLRVEGTVQGIAEYGGTRYLVVKLDRADLTPPMKAIVKGHAMIDIETAVPETVVAEIELVVLHGTDTSVFRFVERRVLVPEPAPQ